MIGTELLATTLREFSQSTLVLRFLTRGPRPLVEDPCLLVQQLFWFMCIPSNDISHLSELVHMYDSNAHNITINVTYSTNYQPSGILAQNANILFQIPTLLLQYYYYSIPPSLQHIHQ
jgi:hypothetical protein